MISLLGISWRRQKVGYISTVQWSSSVTWLTNINLFDSDGRRRVWDRKRERDNNTVPAPVTGYVIPLALEMQVHLGWGIWEKSLGSKVIWSVASESMIQAPSVWDLELKRTWPQLSRSVTEVEISARGMRESWGSALTTIALPTLASIAGVSRFFRACNSCHQSGYPCLLKQVSRVCFVLP